MNEVRNPQQYEEAGPVAITTGILMAGQPKMEEVAQAQEKDAAVQDRREAEPEVRRRLTPQQVDAVAFNEFIKRLKEFLAGDVYWMHILAMPGGRTKRRQVGEAVKKLVFTIPHFQENGPFNREMRRKFGA